MASLSLSIYCAVFALLLSFPLCLWASGADNMETEPCAADALRFGFYPYFPPVSYNADTDPEAGAFHSHLGYEADLLTALEALDGAELSFVRHAIPAWDDIWLAAASPQFDIIGGGITMLDSRKRGATGEEIVTFTSGHIAFRQSLLVRAEDAERVNGYDKLHSDMRVGVLGGTTGEGSLLRLVGYVDDKGLLAAGVQVDTPQGRLIADGSDNYVITPAGETPNLAERTRLHPPLETMPQVVYLGGEIGDSALIDALGSGEIDAIARGELGNIAAAQASQGAFVVSALDEAEELGGFSVALADAQLAACLDDKIDWLTDNRRIGFADWVEEPAVFMRRAEIWNERQNQD